MGGSPGVYSKEHTKIKIISCFWQENFVGSVPVFFWSAFPFWSGKVFFWSRNRIVWALFNLGKNI